MKMYKKKQWKKFKNNWSKKKSFNLSQFNVRVVEEIVAEMNIVHLIYVNNTQYLTNYYHF